MERMSHTRAGHMVSPLPLGEGQGVRAAALGKPARRQDLLLGRPHPSPLPKGEGTRTSRRGAILLVILVCFTLAAAMFVVLARLAVLARNAQQTQHWSVQSQWLAEAGLERAAARLAGQPGYSGETWAIPAGQLAGREGGIVRIRVEGLAGPPARRRVAVEADYPDDPVHRSRCKKEITLEERHEKHK